MRASSWEHFSREPSTQHAFSPSKHQNLLSCYPPSRTTFRLAFRKVTCCKVTTWEMLAKRSRTLEAEIPFQVFALYNPRRWPPPNDSELQIMIQKSKHPL